jgi:hypothetical protein
MSNSEEINRSRYAQMQSSIFNKTGSSIVSGSNFGSTGKPNLLNKFGSIEETVLRIEVDAHALTKSARVHFLIV